MKFSVIVPLYNKAPYIKRALCSIFEQTFRDYEIIVVDDGSTDGSLSIARDVLADSAITSQLIHQENAGVSNARNKGFTISQGDYICFLDADDWWHPSFLSKMSKFIEEYPDAGIYGSNYYIISKDKERVALHIPSTGYINYCDCYRKMQMPLWTGAVCIPRDVFSQQGGFKPQLKLGEDFDLWIRIALSHPVAYLNEPLSYYNQDSNPEWRLVGKLHEPKSHMLWNLGYLEGIEKTNQDYKRLIDEIRVYSLMAYYLSPQYHDAAKTELRKVDWKRQSLKTRYLYKLPLPILKSRKVILSLGSKIKQWIIAHL